MESCCHYRNIRPWGYIAAKEQYDVLKTLVADLQDERHQVMLQGIDIVTSSGNSYHISIDIFPMSMIDGKGILQQIQVNCIGTNHNPYSSYKGITRTWRGILGRNSIAQSKSSIDFSIKFFLYYKVTQNKSKNQMKCQLSNWIYLQYYVLAFQEKRTGTR